MAYSVRVKEFEGPLELLLNLIESKKLSISEISLGSVTGEYFERLGSMKEKSPESYHEEIASFLVIAATLMLIKSRSLLPGFQISADEETDIKELEDRLKAYKRIKEMAVELQRIALRKKHIYTRPAYAALAPSFLPPRHTPEVSKMLGLLKNMLAAIPKRHELPKKIIRKIISLEEKITELKKRIEEGVVRTFSDFVDGQKEKLEVIVSFLAMLELVKLGIIAVQQSAPFELIQIHHGTRKKS